MQFIESEPKDIADLKERIDQGDEVERMLQTPGWKIVEGHLRDQLQAYMYDNASRAEDWNDYLKKAGKIAGIELLLTDISDFVEFGKQAAEELSKIEQSSKG